MKPLRRKVLVQPDGGLCRPLRRDKTIPRLRVGLVALSLDGKDLHGNYQGRTGVPLYVLEYPDKELIFYRARDVKDFLWLLKRRYPKAEITFGNIRGLEPYNQRIWDQWPDTLKQLKLFPELSED